MKTLLLSFTFAFMSLFLSAQQLSMGMRYQAVVRDADGKIIADEPITARIEMVTMEGISQVYYEEIHEVRTNEFGLINLTIGQGEAVKGAFISIPWEDQNIWVRTSFRLQGSQQFDIVTTNQLYSVPYAQYARTAGTLIDNQVQSLGFGDAFLKISPYWSLTGNYKAYKYANPPKMGTLDETPIVFITNGIERMRITEIGSMNITTPLAVDSSVVIGGGLTVIGNTDLKSHLNVDSSSSIAQDLQVGGTINLLGDLNAAGNASITQNLSVTGKTTIADSLKVNGPVVLDIEVDGPQTEQTSYPVLIKGSKQGLAIDLVPATDNCFTSHRGNNYISFWRDGEQKGRIEGMGRADLDPTGLLGMLISVFKNPAVIGNGLAEFGINLSDPFVNFGNELASTISFSTGSLPELSGGSLPSLDPGKLPSINFSGPSFNKGKLPELDQGSFPTLSGGMLPEISFNAPSFSNPLEGTQLQATFGSLFENYSAAGKSGDAACFLETVSPAQASWSIMRAALMDSQLYPDDPTNFESQIFSNYTLDILLAGIGTLKSAITFFSSFGSVLDPEDIYSKGVDLLTDILGLVIYGSYSDINVGVAYESGAGDYAEWLKRANPDELIQPGDVVGVIGGRISREFTHADRFMVVSTSPLLLGNMPENAEEERLSEKVAFMGQVPVKVMGAVRIGDYILPSGSGDGIAIAVHPSDMLAKDYQRIVGIAWEESPADGFMHLINTAVGINHNDMARTIEQMQFTLNHIQAQLKKMDPSYESHDYEVTIDEFGGASLDYSVAATHHSKTADYFRGKTYESNTEVLADVRNRMMQVVGLDLSEIPLIDYAFNHPEQSSCVANQYQSILEDMIRVKNEIVK